MARCIAANIRLLREHIQMSRDPDFLPLRLAEAATSAAMLATLEQLLATRWDPDRVIWVALAARSEGPDPTRPRSLAQAAAEVAGILASGGGEPEVSGYLKREELALFGPVHDETLKARRRERREFVRAALWRAVRGIPRPGDLPGPQNDAAI
jgi:hypothetical protein